VAMTVDWERLESQSFRNRSVTASRRPTPDKVQQRKSNYVQSLRGSLTGKSRFQRIMDTCNWYIQKGSLVGGPPNSEAFRQGALTYIAGCIAPIKR